MSGVDLAKEFKANAVETAAKYKGKVLEIAGVVTDTGFVGQFNGGGPFLVVEPAKSPEAGHGTREFAVTCFTAEKQPWVLAKPGQTVHIQGHAAGDSLHGFLEKCQILEVTGSLPPSTTTEQVMADFATDQTAAKKKYEDKWWIVTGKITKVDTPTNFQGTAFFSPADAKKPMGWMFDTGSDREVETLQKSTIGQEITVLGKGASRGFDSCRFVPKPQGK